MKQKVKKVKVTVKKTGWTHRGEDQKVEAVVEVTEAQAEMLKIKGIV